ncbi:unnamed protein product [Paramecium sonneborni]|uniref:Uncharacterized protein n=1 Tax=Paramecium sonneborni TaxID=65129 RepID=A0A8S1LF05_9CILI|nr:unnamed protein product [Paramecium sonneborni]
MQINSQQTKNEISESPPHKSEHLLDEICQKLNQICTTSVQISGRIIQKRKNKRRSTQNSRDKNKISKQFETEECISQLIQIEQLFLDLSNVKELVSILE